MKSVILVFFSFLSLHTVWAQNSKKDLDASVPGFLENKGQIIDQKGHPNASVKYLLHIGRGMNVQIRNDGFSYDTYQSYLQKPKQKISHLAIHRVDVYFEDLNPATQLIHELPFPTIFNYYNCPGKPSMQVHSYQRVTYKNLYPFIDLVFDCKRGAMEYFFVVHPGGDVQKIRMRWMGANSIRVHENRIMVSVDKGNWQERLPESYSDSTLYFQRNKTSAAKKVSVSYRQIRNNIFGFTTGNYDKNTLLIIDPTPDLIWGTYLGGDLNDWGFALSTDANGNIFMGGATCNNALATAGAYKTIIDGYMDAMLGKFSADGKPLWLNFYGGSEEDAFYGVSVDRENSVIGFGQTFSTDKIATPGSFKTIKTSHEGASDAFIAKFTNDGSLIWATYYGGEESVIPRRVVTDQKNNIFITGSTNCTEGITTPGSFQSTYDPTNSIFQEDGFLTKFTPGGNLVWGTYFGGNDFDRFNGVAVDKDQNIIAAGISWSTNLKVSPTGYQALNKGSSDAMIVKFTNDGNLIWATYYGGESEDYAMAVCTDSKSNIFIAGTTNSVGSIATNGSQQVVKGADLDGFIVKFKSSGDRIWGTYSGGDGQDYPEDMTCDFNDNIAFCGSTSSPTNIATPGSFQPIIDIPGTLYIERYTNDGIRQWGTYYGRDGVPGSGSDAFGIVTFQDYVYITGETLDKTNIATCDAFQLNWVANGDSYLAKFGTSLSPSCLVSLSPNGTICAGQAATFHATTKDMGINIQYQWYRNQSPVGGNDSLYIDNSPTPSEQVYCIVQNCAGNLISSNKLSPVTDPGLSPAISIAGPTDSVCNGTVIVINSDVQNAGLNPKYQWQVNGVNSGTDSVAFVSNSLQNGDLITCIVINTNSCSANLSAQSNEISIKIKSVPASSIVISADSNPVCKGSMVHFIAMATHSGNDPRFQWQVDGLPVGTNESIFATSSLSDGNLISCILIPDNVGCGASQILSNNITIKVYPVPLISLSGQAILSTPGATQLTASIDGSFVSFSWSPTVYLSNTQVLNPIATPLYTTTYRLEVTDEHGCKTSKDYTIQSISRISIPNAFTPNGDGINDVFRPIYGSEISQVSFMIYNRWGQMVFSDKGSHKSWDGTIDGESQPAGTYVWFFRYTDAGGNHQMLKGTVVLTR